MTDWIRDTAGTVSNEMLRTLNSDVLSAILLFGAPLVGLYGEKIFK
jgi:hypothetical protein